VQRRGIKTGWYRSAGVQALAGRAGREVADVCTAHVRARYSGWAGRCRRRV